MAKTNKLALVMLVAQFESAVREDEMSGAGHPSDIPLIEEDLRAARDALMKAIDELAKG